MTYLDYAGPADVTIFGSYTIVVTYIPIYLGPKHFPIIYLNERLPLLIYTQYKQQHALICV